MQDRETALKEQENAREWQAIAYGDRPETWAALDYYRELGWPVDSNKFPERERVEGRIFAFMSGYREALKAAVDHPPPSGASPQAETSEDEDDVPAVQDSERAQKANGVVLVFIDERGHAIAHAADFEPQAPGGFTLIEGQRHRARRVLAGAVCAAYASPSFVRGIEPYDAQMIMDKLCRAHGCQIHEVIVGQESADV